MDDFMTREEMWAIPAREISDPARLAAEPMVSVLMMTYNHEPLIAEAIRGVVEQECDFAVELLIGEDCSTDRTREICEAYQKRYPHIVRLVVSDANIKRRGNFARICARARGRYVALCEGDDRWVNPRKLARQVSLLEEHPESAMCFAIAHKRRWAEGRLEFVCEIAPPVLKPAYDFVDFRDYIAHTSTVVVRETAYRLPRWFFDLDHGDTPLYLLCADQGPVLFLNELVSYWIDHGGGIWTGMHSTVRRQEMHLKTWETFFRNWKPERRRFFADLASEAARVLTIATFDEGDLAAARAYHRKAVCYFLRAPSPAPVRTLVMNQFRLYWPWAHRALKRAAKRLGCAGKSGVA